MRRLTPAFRYVDDAVGERRSGLANADGAPLTLTVERWSDAGRVARLGALAVARVTEIAPQFAGAFVDFGLDPPGFLPFKGGHTPKGLHQGALIRVEIAAEAQPPAWGGKGPRVRRAPGVAEGPPRLLSPPPDARGDGEAHSAVADLPPREARDVADRAVEEALARIVPLPGGGDLALEPTRAFWAVDVDAGGHMGARDRASAARAVNRVASAEIARQAALRSLGGVMVVDMITTPDRDGAAQIRAGLEAAFAALAVKADIAFVSRSGLVAMTLPRRRRAVHELATDRDGALTDETLALMGLRALETAGAAARGAPRLTLRLAPGPGRWLEADTIGWRDALHQRLGPRFALDVDAAAPRETREVFCP